MSEAAVQDAGTVQVRIQVIDVDAAALDMVLPTYLPAKDLTQRIARDSNLGAYWPDGTRRLFWLRARGRILDDAEKLDDLGVVHGELLHLLPQPPQGSSVIERPPDYPPKMRKPRSAVVNVIGSLGAALVLSVVWATALTVSANAFLVALPAIALALLATSAARHAFGPPGSHIRIPGVGAALFVVLYLGVFLVPAIAGTLSVLGAVLVFLGGLVAGLIGVVLGWLAWYGAVEPLPAEALARADAAAAALEQGEEAPAVEAQTASCAICGGEVDLTDPEVYAECKFACGRVFHAGCYRAREAVHALDTCSVCGYNPEAA